MIYAIEYRTTVEEEVVRCLIEHGADVNHVDMSGLTPLFYAIYRGIFPIVRFLLINNADHKYENLLGYSPLRYALCCLSYFHPSDGSIYSRRLDIVTILLEKYQLNQIDFHQALISHSPTVSHLFPLFDFIFYTRIQSRFDFEQIAWQLFERTSWPCEKSYGNFLIAQNLIIFNSNFQYLIYFFQRMFIKNYYELIQFYLQRFIKDKQTMNRFLLLLYCSFVEMGGNR